MEKVQGLQNRGKDGPTMQFWPAYQHGFFQSQTCSSLTQNPTDDATNLHQLPLPWHSAQLDHQRLHASSGARNWSQNLEWDSLALSAQATTNANRGGTHSQWAGRDSEFSSPSPPENFEQAGLQKEPTLLEFGLSRQAQAVSEEDEFLDLKLGGNGHISGAGEVSPSSKRSRHSPSENQQTRCQVDNCAADLQSAKDYHRRHKVCEVHAKAPKALVGTLIQRFCQQCSRFHLLKEFDDDRRSCRKRLAGHNRRRRKTQPDAATALACLLTDQSVFSRIIGPSGQQQGKDDLEKLLQEQTLVQTLLNARAAVGNPDNKRPETAPQNNLLNALSQSHLLSNLLLSNPTLGCNLPATPAPADTLISALSNALLASLPRLQKDNGDTGCGGSLPIQETMEQPEPYANASSFHTSTNQKLFPRYPADVQPGSLALSNSMERAPVFPTTPPVYSDKSNNSNGDSLDERGQFDPCQKGSREGPTQQDRRHWLSRDAEAAVVHTTGSLQRAGAKQFRESGCLPPAVYASSQGDQFETRGGSSDHSSDASFEKQVSSCVGRPSSEQTGSLWFKIFDKDPADIPSSMRSKILKWLDHVPSDVEGHIKPGCIILSVFVCMPVSAWAKLCGNIQESLQELISISDDDFWRTGRVLAHFGKASAYIVDGKVYPNDYVWPLQIPSVVSVQPFAAMVGETVELTVRGVNLKAPGIKIACAFQGKCIVKEMEPSPYVRDTKKRDREVPTSLSAATEESSQEQMVTFTVGPFNSMGRGFVEVEGQIWRGFAFPLIVADRPICKEISSLEKKYRDSTSTTIARSSTLETDIPHFLHELGWLLQRVERKDHYLSLEMPEFSTRRYRWLLRFAVEHCCCAVVRWTLDLLFSTGDGSADQGRLRAQEVLSEANLLHVAVRSKSIEMVMVLVSYSPPYVTSSVEYKTEMIFRPDTAISDGFTPLHLAASMQSADGVVDALTAAPAEVWARAWTTAKDAFGKTPAMYALASGNDSYVKIVQGKLQKLGNDQQEDATRPPYVSLNIGGDHMKPNILSPVKSLSRKQILSPCNCRVREAQSLPIRIRGLNKGFMHRPFVVSMLAVAAVCVCVGVLMRGAPDVNFLQGPFVWESIRFGPI